jgi:enamine deaminase RidA (YjgF/YER057c/UK114 family)
MTLPTPPLPRGKYITAVDTNSLIFTSGMTPRIDGVLKYAGKVGRDVSVEGAQAAARIAAANAIAVAVQAAGSLEAIQRAVRMTVYVNAIEEFEDHSSIADSASDLLWEILGERGAVVRTTVGVASLPGGACIEVELTFVR